MAWPANIETLVTSHQDNVGENIVAFTDNEQARITNALMLELGVHPSGAFSDVAAKLNALRLDTDPIGDGDVQIFDAGLGRFISGKLLASSIEGYPNDASKTLLGDGTWGSGGVSYGTTLPASPTNGQEHVLVDDLAAPKGAWRMRFSTDVTDDNKWVCIGGDFWYKRSDGGVSYNFGSETAGYQNGPSPIPAITVPRAGLWLVKQGGSMYGGGNDRLFQSYAINAAAALDADMCIYGHYGPSDGGSFERTQERTFAANDVLTPKFKKEVGSGATMTIQGRFIGIRPIRIA